MNCSQRIPRHLRSLVRHIADRVRETPQQDKPAGHFFERRPETAEAVHMSVRNLRRAFKHLEDLGVIATVSDKAKKGGRRRFGKNVAGVAAGYYFVPYWVPEVLQARLVTAPIQVAEGGEIQVAEGGHGVRLPDEDVLLPETEGGHVSSFLVLKGDMVSGL